MPPNGGGTENFMKSIRETAGDAFGIPKDISLNMPRITVSADAELYMENYGSLLSFSDTSMTVGGRLFTVTVSGAGFEIKSIRRDDLTLIGKILHIEYKFN